jgi:hypothetical protein
MRSYRGGGRGVEVSPQRGAARGNRLAGWLLPAGSSDLLPLAYEPLCDDIDLHGNLEGGKPTATVSADFACRCLRLEPFQFDLSHHDATHEDVRFARHTHAAHEREFEDRLLHLCRRDLFAANTDGVRVPAPKPNPFSIDIDEIAGAVPTVRVDRRCCVQIPEDRAVAL